MKRSIPLLLSALIATSVLLHAEADSPLEKQMQILARGMKQLGLQLGDPSKQKSTITLINTLKKAAIDSESLDPRKTASVPESDRSQFLTAYKAEVQKLTDTFTDVENAVLAGQYDKAKSLLDTIQGIKKEGHSKFKQD